MLQDEGSDVTEYRVRLYQKIALPMASLIFALIGTPLGLRPHRSSSAMGLGLAIVIIFGYWVLMHYMTILGDNGAVTPAAAAFIPTFLGCAAGIALIARAAK
jgi:lipopolysaccharide export system permease protein